MKLRVPLTGAVLLTFLVAVQAGAHRHRPDHLMTSFSNAWNEHDVEGAVDLFEEDGVLAAPDASYAKGRSEVRRLLRTLLDPDRGSTLSIGRDNLNYREFWHWAIIDREAVLAVGGEMRPVLVTAVLIQTKDGPGELDCNQHDPCDEWSLVSLWIVEDTRSTRASTQ